MKLLDLFCCAGGAAKGYAAAGFDVVGVDVVEQPNYPYEFVRGDALDVGFVAELAADVDAVHASPPCQGYSTQTADQSRHERLIEPVRAMLVELGKPFVIENVEGARRELVAPARLCGSSFGLDVRRHRYFETSWPFAAPPCNHAWQTPRFRSLDMSMVRRGRLASVVGVHGHLNYPGEGALRKAAMGVDWMTQAELAESIPPAFTEYIGRQLAGYVRARFGRAACELSAAAEGVGA